MFKGFKKIFLVLCLMFASSIVFVACEKNKVKVTSVIFKETESITMIMGQSYVPNVSVAPSYASNKSYYFIAESETDVLRIDNHTIVALKEGVAQLKVVSDENKYLTDIIAVRVLPTAIELNTPTNLTFNGDKFSFGAVDNALNYFLKINDEEIELGNSTSYSLSQYQTQFGVSPYDKVFNVKVRAEGDSRITIPSPYSSTLSVLKIGIPEDVKVEDSVLKFTKIKNVAKYLLQIYTPATNVLSIEILSTDYDENVIEIDLAEYKELFTGGQYFCKLICSDEGYIKENNERVSISDERIISFDVLSKPKNLVISDYVLYWDSVLGADSYTLYDDENIILQDNIATTSVNLKELGIHSGSYSYKIIANSNKNINVVSTLNISELITVSILEKPTVSVGNKTISWSSVAGATSYKLLIYKDGKVLKDINIVGTSYSVANFAYGEYDFEVFSIGDNNQKLSSLESAIASFEILQKASNLKVENKIISWDSEKGTKFDLKIYDTTSSEPYINEIVTGKTFDISGYNFLPGEFTIKIETLGEDSVFNSEIVSSKFYKLSEIKEVKIANKIISFTIDGRTSSSEIVCYDKTNTSVKYDVLTSKSKTQYLIDANSLPAGTFTIEAKAFGNNGNVLDADNTADTRFLEIRKIGKTSLSVNKPDLNVYKSSSVDYAEKYELYLNDEKVKTFTKDENYTHDVSNFTPGEYEFKIKALGNNADVLDGEISDTSVKVLKLDTPKLSLNKTSLVYTIKTNETQDRFVSSYDFTINEESVDFPTTSKTLDCSSLFNMAQAYVGKIRLIAGSSAEYDLILNSDEASASATKINSTSELSVIDGKILIVPTTIGADGRHHYKPTISIGYIEGSATEYTYVEYEATYDSDLKGFVIDVYNENYEVTGPRKADGSYIFADAGTFDFKLTLERKDYITSDTYPMGIVTKLNEVTNIKKVSTANANANIAPSEKITFNQVDRASKYQLRITVKGVNYIVDNIDAGTSSLTIDEIKKLFKGENVSPEALTINGGSTYYLEIIAIGDNGNKILTSNVSSKFKMQLIKWPTINIDSQNVLSVTDLTVAEKIYITCTDTSSNKNKYYKMLDIASGETSLDLDLVSGLVAGDVNISVSLVSSNANAFKSSGKTTKYTQLAQPVLTVADGLLKWEINENAGKYLLKYTKDGKTEILTLSNGSDNFSVADGVASYELKGVEVGTSTITVQNIGKGWVTTTGEDGKEVNNFYYDSPVSSEISIIKLSQPISEVKNGEIKLILNAVDYGNNYIGSVKINGKNVTTYTTFGQEMIINGYDLLKYNTDKEIQQEVFNVTVQAKSVEGVYILNAEDYSFSVKGVKPISDISIVTDYNPDNEIKETIDKINWVASPLNTGLVKGYLIKVIYGSKPYEYLVEGDVTSFTFPTEEAFGAGNYDISIRTLTDTEGYVHSQFSESLTVTVCEKPTDLRTTNGVVVWNKVTGANEYVVYLYNKDNELKKHIQVENNQFDFSSVDYGAGLYKIKVFAMNQNDSKIVSGQLSDEIEVYRVPEITQYKVEQGNLYLYTHSYATKVELKLTLKTNSEVGPSYTVDLEPVLPDGSNWSTVSDLDSYLNEYNVDEKSVGWKYSLVNVENNKELSSILNMIDGQYTLEIKAIGNSTEATAKDNAKMCTVNSKVTSVTNNLNNAYKVEGTDTNYVQKLRTPNICIDERGIVEFGLDLTYTDCKYYKLNGLLIYDVNLSVGATDYSFYVVDNYYVGCVDSSMVYVYKETDTHTYYGYIKYEYETDKYLYLNIIRSKDSESDTYSDNLKIDFTQEMLYFLNKEGETERIDLKVGGNFKVSVSILGDDTVYLTSNISEVKNIIRYRQLDLNIINGYLTWDNLKEGTDNPIYLLRITDSTGKESLVYVYDSKTTLNTDKLPEIIDENTYYLGVDATQSKFAYMLDTMSSDKYVFEGGNYTVNITTYFSDSTDNSRLEARSSADIKFEKLETPTITSGGKITWNQIKVGRENIQNYLVRLSGGNLAEPITYTISQTDYTITSGVISYLLPQNITDINGNVHTLEGAVENYLISIGAIDDTRYVNSNMSSNITFDISDYVTDVQMQDGVLTWKWGEDSSEGGYEIKIDIYKKDETLLTTCVTSTNSKSYVLSGKLNDIYGSSFDFATNGENYSYKIYVKRIGSGTTLTGFYQEAATTEKLKVVEYSSITSNNGELTWNAITGLQGQTIDVNYVIEFVGSELEDVIIENNTSFDFAGYEPGKYTIKITPKSSIYFTGNTSGEFVVYKLPQVGAISNPQINDVSNILRWNAVSVTTDNNEQIFAERYQIEIYDAESEELLLTDFVYDENKTGIMQYSLATESVYNIKVRVRALMISETGSVINAEWSNYTSFTRAESIDSNNFKVNEEKLRFEWHGIASEQEGDRYILKYSYKEAEDSVSSFKTTSLIVSNYELGQNSVKVYYFVPSLIGFYTDISVTVNRGSSLSSETVTMKDVDGNNVKYTFDKFASGDGSVDKPYVITSIEHLNHIKIFPDKNFVLDLSQNQNELSLASINEMLIDTEFKGTFDGAGYTLKNYELTTTANMVGMFRSLNGATIKNLNINYATINITNIYNGTVNYGGILAGKAIDSNISNVNITYSLLNVSATDGKEIPSSSDYVEFYYGGMFGYIQNTTISNSHIQLGYEESETVVKNTTLQFIGSNRNAVYYGGIAGYAINSTYSGTEHNLNNVTVCYQTQISRISGASKYPFIYFGGVFGQMSSSNVDYANIYLKQSDACTGDLETNAGVCGYIETVNTKITFSNITIDGNISHKLTVQKQEDTYIRALYCGTDVASSADIKITYSGITDTLVIVS